MKTSTQEAARKVKTACVNHLERLYTETSKRGDILQDLLIQKDYFITTKESIDMVVTSKDTNAIIVVGNLKYWNDTLTRLMKYVNDNPGYIGLLAIYAEGLDFKKPTIAKIERACLDACSEKEVKPLWFNFSNIAEVNSLVMQVNPNPTYSLAIYPHGFNQEHAETEKALQGDRMSPDKFATMQNVLALVREEKLKAQIQGRDPDFSFLREIPGLGLRGLKEYLEVDAYNVPLLTPNDQDIDF